MMRKLNRNYSLSVVVPFVAILTLLIAAAVLAQTPSADRPSGQANAVLAPVGTSAPAQVERPLTPWTDGAGGSPVSHSQTKRHGARPMDGNPLFLGVVDYDSAGNGTCFVALADLNGDGKPDLLVANASGVAVLLGNGDGTFQPAVTYGSGGSSPWSVAVADVNRDGNPDLLVVNVFDNTVGVLLGNGDGTFQAAVTYSSGGGFRAPSIAVADLNGDGKPDLAVANDCGGCDGS